MKMKKKGKSIYYTKKNDIIITQKNFSRIMCFFNLQISWKGVLSGHSSFRLLKRESIIFSKLKKIKSTSPVSF